LYSVFPTRPLSVGYRPCLDQPCCMLSKKEELGVQFDFQLLNLGLVFDGEDDILF
jgi:hypothetical protein